MSGKLQVASKNEVWVLKASCFSVIFIIQVMSGKLQVASKNEVWALKAYCFGEVRLLCLCESLIL